MFDSILSQYGLEKSHYSMAPFGNGLINRTWKIMDGDKEWLLQRINHLIFPKPEDIMANFETLSGYFKKKYPGYLFVAPVNTIHGLNFVRLQTDEIHYYRLFPFIKNSYSCNEVSTPALAYEASKQFGKFTRLLSAFDPAQLHVTLSRFHDLLFRYQQFESAVREGNKERIVRSAEYISFLKSQSGIVGIFEKISSSSSFTLRVIHHDAKINNVLFNHMDDKGLCVIDLDTVMSGYFISDVGDMLRTYLSPVSEEEEDFRRIEIREDYFREVARGYLGEMHSELNKEEKQYFVYAGKFAIYMQALRFLTDYINDDQYYSTKYEDQNLVRAMNQIVLLKKFLEKEERLTGILNSSLQGF
jgi:Ser/Thr protein kinase RdoA (MazF antagonist)